MDKEWEETNSDEELYVDDDLEDPINIDDIRDFLSCF